MRGDWVMSLFGERFYCVGCKSKFRTNDFSESEDNGKRVLSATCDCGNSCHKYAKKG
jgi:hypothetical protein